MVPEVDGTHYDVRLSEHFMLREFLHEGITCVPLDVLNNLFVLAENLEVLRREIGKPVNVNSGYRTPEHNEKVGGSPNSQHLLGKAGDIWVKDVSSLDLYYTVERMIRVYKMKQGGLGLYNSFVHYDIRGTRARWDYRK